MLPAGQGKCVIFNVFYGLCWTAAKEIDGNVTVTFLFVRNKPKVVKKLINNVSFE